MFEGNVVGGFLGYIFEIWVGDGVLEGWEKWWKFLFVGWIDVGLVILCVIFFYGCLIVGWFGWCELGVSGVEGWNWDCLRLGWVVCCCRNGRVFGSDWWIWWVVFYL